MDLRPMSTADVDYFERSGRTYHLRPPTIRDDTWCDLEATRRCGRAVHVEERLETLRAGIFTALDGDEQTHALAAIAEWEAARDVWRATEPQTPIGATNGDVPADVKAAREALNRTYRALQRVEGEVSRCYPKLATLLATEEGRTAELMFLRVQVGVVGWDGIARPCERRAVGGRQVLTDAALNAIPPDDLWPIAGRVAELATLTQADRGNSASPSGASATLTSPTTA